MMRMLQTSSVIFQKNNRTVTLTRQDFVTNRGYRAGFDVWIKFYCDILRVSRLKPFFSMESKCKRLEKRTIVVNEVLALIKHDDTKNLGI